MSRPPVVVQNLDTPEHLPLLERAGDHALLRSVPSSADRVLVVGLGDSWATAALKAQRPGRKVFGLKPGPAGVTTADHMDCVFGQDLHQVELPLDAGSLDAIVYLNALPHLRDLEAVLRRHRLLLNPNGVAVVLIPNARHYATVLGLVRGDIPFVSGLCALDPPAWHYTRSGAQRLLLDAGYLPDLVGSILDPAPSALADRLLALLELPAGATKRDRRELDISAFVFQAYPDSRSTRAQSRDPDQTLTFITCVSNESVVRDNLLASPDLRVNSPHEVILVRHCRSAADGLNLGIARARNEVVIGVHQDVYLPRGWCSRFAQQWREAETRFGPLGVAGVFGVAGRDIGARRVGRVVDRCRLLRTPEPLPAAVDSLDELFLAVNKGGPVKFDALLGFHLYGTAACITAARHGRTNVVLDAPCLHNSNLEVLPSDFGTAVAAFANRWKSCLPVATSCVKISSNGNFVEW